MSNNECIENNFCTTFLKSSLIVGSSIVISDENYIFISLCTYELFMAQV